MLGIEEIAEFYHTPKCYFVDEKKQNCLMPNFRKKCSARVVITAFIMLKEMVCNEALYCINGIVLEFKYKLEAIP